MKSVSAIALVMITSSMALAAKPAANTPIDPCERNAQIASQKILRAFDWSRGTQPMQVVLTDDRTDKTGVNVKMVKTSGGCKVEEVSLSNGAAFQEELAKELKKMEADFKKK